MKRLAGAFTQAFRKYYPTLIAAFSVLSVYQANLEDVPIADILRPLLLACTLAFCLTWALRRAFQPSARGGLAAAGTLVVFFSYGQIFDAVQGVEVGGFPLGHHRYLVLGLGALWLAWVVWVGWRLRQPVVFERAVRGFATIAVLLPLLGLGLRGAQELTWRAETAPGPEPAIVTSDGTSAEATPDIYYLILDGYGRADILEQYYQVDNSPFTDWLDQRGFFVASEATSNYNQTVLSLSSSMNMDYLDDFAQQVGSQSTSRAQLADQLKHSQLRMFLQDRGYRVVAFETGYSQTEIRDADFFWAPEAGAAPYPIIGGRLTRFESLFLDATAVRAVLDLDLLRRQLIALDPGQSLYAEHRKDIQFTLESLGKAAALPGPKFVFAHVIAPHPPFVFGPEGEPLRVKGAFSLADADAFGGGPEAYVAGYRDQLQYVNSLVRQAVEGILSRSDRPPVILIQGDHGPGAHMVWDSAEQSLVEERFSILSAYYFPDQDYQELYDSISPVNSFRVVLDHFFGANLALLPDRSYFATWDQPLDFTEVTDRVRP